MDNKLEKYNKKIIIENIEPKEYDLPDDKETIINLAQCSDRIHYKAMYKKDGIKGTSETCYVKAPIYEKLLKILDKLGTEYEIDVFDAYRTIETQEDLYDIYVKKYKEKYKKEHREELENKSLKMTAEELDKEIEEIVKEELKDYIASPHLNLKRPPAHLTGGAIDLCLVKDGMQMYMGTDFDEFSKKSNTDYYEKNDVDEEIRENRRLLYNVMLEEGFVNLSSEWWHFEYGTSLWADITKKKPMYGYLEIPSFILDNKFR